MSDLERIIAEMRVLADVIRDTRQHDSNRIKKRRRRRADQLLEQFHGYPKHLRDHVAAYGFDELFEIDLERYERGANNIMGTVIYQTQSFGENTTMRYTISDAPTGFMIANLLRECDTPVLEPRAHYAKEFNQHVGNVLTTLSTALRVQVAAESLASFDLAKIGEREGEWPEFMDDLRTASRLIPTTLKVANAADAAHVLAWINANAETSNYDEAKNRVIPAGNVVTQTRRETWLEIRDGDFIKSEELDDYIASRQEQALPGTPVDTVRRKLAFGSAQHDFYTQAVKKIRDNVKSLTEYEAQGAGAKFVNIFPVVS